MKGKSASLLAAVLLAAGLASPAQAVLMNHGDSGEYFFDTDSGLYWWDPEAFVSLSKTEIDDFVAANSKWKYASHFEIDALIGKSSAGGVPLTEVMGAHQLETAVLTTSGWFVGSRWIGFYDGICSLADCGILNPDGWIAETVLNGDPLPLSDLSTIGDAGYQGSVDGRPVRGAWINSRFDPLAVAEPEAFSLLAAGLAMLGFAWRRRSAARG